jgi:hypothetical protein
MSAIGNRQLAINDWQLTIRDPLISDQGSLVEGMAFQAIRKLLQNEEGFSRGGFGQTPSDRKSP